MTPGEQQQVIRDYLRDLARLAVDELLESADQKKAGEGLETTPAQEVKTGGNDSAHTPARAT
jgi:hypothetical protein